MTIDFPTAALIPQMRELWKEAFGDTEEYLDTFFTTGYDPRRAMCAVRDGVVLSAVYWLNCTLRGQKVAYLYALATAKAYQGRGIAHKLMDAVHNHLEQQGYAGTILVPGEEKLFAFYEAMGYEQKTKVSEFFCAGAADEVQLRRINADAYLAQRRELLSFLEEGGVLQEEENMALLATQANFYAGQNFLLAARAEDGVLVGLELLGDAQTAPGILQSLGYASGRFRTRGTGKDFAVFRPLGDRAIAPPTYFGLAFD